MAESSRWTRYRDEVFAACQDFGFVYADLKHQGPSGDGWVAALCPLHKDSTPSFAFHRPTGNWKCHAGCGQGDALRYLKLTAGLDYHAALKLLGDRLGLPAPRAEAHPEQCYAYTDENGVLLFEVVRFGGKKFRQRRPDGQGGHVWNLNGTRRVLYRLTDLQARSSEPVFIVEGEKDVERLHAAGRLATTNPGGAGKWRDEYTAFLRERDVVILPDNDTPGRDHAGQVTRSLHGTAASIRVVELPGLPEKGDVSDWLDAGHPVEELDELVSDTAPWQPHQPVAARPQVIVSGRQLSDLIDEAWLILRPAAQRLRLFRGASGLVRVVDGESGPMMIALGEVEMYGLLAREADWMRRWGQNLIHARPPKDLARDLLALPDPSLPYLEAVVTTPVFTPRGDLLATPGYDPDSRLWYEPTPGFTLPDVPAKPTEDDAAEAVRLLTEELLVDFPFAAESDEAHALAALTLPFVRRLIPGCAPIHLIEAPVPGAGKSLFADLISIVARGRACEATTLTRDENEARKKITAMLAHGALIVLVDNVRKELDSAQLASALTAEVWTDRILGATRMVEFPNRATWLVTANNPKLSLEIARRSIRIRLNPEQEQPWERDGFKHDPIRGWARQERPRLVAAVLTLVQYWLAKGRPAGQRKLGSFEDWAAVMGGILRCAGVRGFLEDTADFYAAADSDSQEWRAFAVAWAGRHGQQPVKVSDLVRLAEQEELLGSVLRDGSPHSQATRLGSALRQHRDRQLGDYRVICEQDDHTKSTRYRLLPAISPTAAWGREAAGPLRDLRDLNTQGPAQGPATEGES